MAGVFERVTLPRIDDTADSMRGLVEESLAAAEAQRAFNDNVGAGRQDRREDRRLISKSVSNASKAVTETLQNAKPVAVDFGATLTETLGGALNQTIDAFVEIANGGKGQLRRPRAQRDRRHRAHADQAAHLPRSSAALERRLGRRRLPGIGRRRVWPQPRQQRHLRILRWFRRRAAGRHPGAVYACPRPASGGRPTPPGQAMPGSNPPRRRTSTSGRWWWPTSAAPLEARCGRPRVSARSSRRSGQPRKGPAAVGRVTALVLLPGQPGASSGAMRIRQ